MSKIKKRITICLAICFYLALCIVISALIKVLDKEEPVIVEETSYIVMEDDEDFMNEVKDDDSFLLHLEYTNRYKEAEKETKEELSEYELEQKRIEIMDRIGEKYLDRLEAETLDMNGETYKIVFIDWDGNEIPVSEEDIKEKGYYAVYEELEEEDRVALSLMIGFAYYHADDPEYGYTLEQDTELMFVLPCEEPGNIISGHNAERLITMDGSHKNYLEDKIKLAEEIANDVKNKAISGEIKDINSDIRGAKADGELLLKDTSGIIVFSIIYNDGWIEIWDVSKPPITDIAYLYKLRYDENE